MAQSRMPAVEHAEIPLPAGNLHLVQTGSGEPLFLIHGGHGSWTHWVANIEPLARRRRVIALDLPGFGASFEPKPAYSIEQYARTVGAVLDALAIDRAAIAGFSFGCAVSAATARLEPDRITHLAMVNPPGIGPGSPTARRIQQELTELTVRKGLRTGAAESLRRLQLFDHALIDDALIELMMANVQATRFVSRNLSHASSTDRILGEVRQPILLIIGREDIHRQFGLAEALRMVPACAPHARIHLIEHARHWLQYDRAARFNELVDDFLG